MSSINYISIKRSLLDLLNEKYTMTFFVGVMFLAVLFTMDIVTTEIVLILGGTEVNFLMEYIVASPYAHAVIKTGVLILIAFFAHWCNHLVKDSGNYILAVAIGWYGFVISNNVCAIISCIN